jgi:hypothetical protein
LSAETLAAHGVADAEMEKFTKSLFAEYAVASLQSAATALRVSWETQTLPWVETTVRAQPHGWPVSALCGRSLVTAAYG